MPRARQCPCPGDPGRLRGRAPCGAQAHALGTGLAAQFTAWQRGDAGYFYVPDEHARSVGAKLVTQLIWYGSVHTPFNFELAQELLQDAGFHGIHRCAFRESASGIEGITALDNRERESFFVEARA